MLFSLTLAHCLPETADTQSQLLCSPNKERCLQPPLSVGALTLCKHTNKLKLCFFRYDLPTGCWACRLNTPGKDNLDNIIARLYGMIRQDCVTYIV